MPRRTLLLILATIIVSYVCYQRADRNPYGRYFAEILESVERNYVEPVDDQKLFESAVKGMISHLDDYSGYITRAETAKFQESLGQKFGGIGIEVSIDPETKQLMVMSPLVGTPAYEAGIQAGDLIVAIDGHDTTGPSFTMEDAVELLRGRPGEEVELRIKRAGEPEPLKYELARAIINVPSVLGDVRQKDDTWGFLLPNHPQIGYVRITSFGEQTVNELREALSWLQERGFEGLILDLRNNPGGLLDAAVGTCELFLDQGDVIVTTRGRDAQIRDEHRASSRGSYRDLPLVVLVNGYSASASEIVAACLQDHDRAVVVGERTWGKGTVQNVIPIEGGRSVLKLTTASYWRPSGKNIHRLEINEQTDEWGVKPSPGMEVKLTDEERLKWQKIRMERDVIQPVSTAASADGETKPIHDPQMERAIEYLEKKMDGAPAKQAA